MISSSWHCPKSTSVIEACTRLIVKSSPIPKCWIRPRERSVTRHVQGRGGLRRKGNLVLIRVVARSVLNASTLQLDFNIFRYTTFHINGIDSMNTICCQIVRGVRSKSRL